MSKSPGNAFAYVARASVLELPLVTDRNDASRARHDRKFDCPAASWGSALSMRPAPMPYHGSQMVAQGLEPDVAHGGNLHRGTVGRPN